MLEVRYVHTFAQVYVPLPMCVKLFLWFSDRRSDLKFENNNLSVFEILAGHILYNYFRLANNWLGSFSLKLKWHKIKRKYYFKPSNNVDILDMNNIEQEYFFYFVRRITVDEVGKEFKGHFDLHLSKVTLVLSYELQWNYW